MPNIRVSSPVSEARVHDIVAQGCPDLDLGRLGPMITASRSAWVAAAIGTRGRTVTVNPWVRDPLTTGLALLLLLTGIGLPIYAVFVLSKQRAVVDRVTAVLQRALAEEVAR